MKTIAFVTQKGGSGKSTLCIDLAVAATQAGACVAILEIDRQATAGDWARLRHGAPPGVAQIEAAEIAPTIARLAQCDFDLVFIDTPGVDGPGAHAAVAAADLCILPCRPTPVDLRAVRPTLATIYRLEKRFAFVLNQTPARSYRVHDAAEGLIALGVLPDVNIVLRNDHQDAIGVGQGVTEFNPKGQAAEEIRRLWRWVSSRLELTSGRTHAATASTELHARAA